VSTRIKDLAISDSGFVFDPFSGGMFTLNPTGRTILESLREGLSEPEIVQRLRDEYDQVAPRVEDDVRDFLRTMKELGLPDRAE
jgi:PqqD family protein of HPr-rel-A system